MDIFVNVIFIAGIGVLLVAWWLFQQEQQKREEERSRHRTELLVQKYGAEDAERILGHKIWQGMTKEQLLESWGEPEDVDEKILKSKTKQVWKYGEVGKNRYRQRVFVENGDVVGWQDQ